MPPPELPLELLIMVANSMRDGYGELRYSDFNAFLQVNRALYACLNRMLWREAGEDEVDTQYVLTYLLKTNNLASLSFFLELGADVELRLPAFDITGVDSYDIGEGVDSQPTPLLLAANLDHVPLAHLLLEKGAKVQYVGKFSPIHAARSAEMVHLLIDHNANPNLDDAFQRPPLYWYAIRNDIAAMREILHYGAEVNPDMPFKKPLHEAAQRNLDAVELLVEHGADVQERDRRGDTPLHFAAMAGKIDVMKFLVERWPDGIRATNQRRTTLLHDAARARHGNSDLVRFLMELWPEGIRERDNSLNTPLHLAASSWRTEVVGLLVEGWPEAVREKNRSGNTPLHLAAAMGGTEVVRILVERWPEGKEALNDRRQTPLSMFENFERFKSQLSDAEKEELVGLLGGQHSQANND